MLRLLTAAIMILALHGTAGATSFTPKQNLNSKGIYASPKQAMPTSYAIKNHYDRKIKSPEDKLLEEAKDLEAVLISVMVDPMFPEGKESGIYGGGQGSDIYRMMMIQEYGKIMSNSGGIGLAENIAKDLTKKQESRND